MNESEALTLLLEDLEFELADDDIVCLYMFGWFLNKFRPQLDDEKIERICRSAYEELRGRRTIKLVWVEWPNISAAEARDAEPGTPLDFQIDAAGNVRSPLQAIVDVG